MIGYICTRNKNIKDHIKCEIGKRYKIKLYHYYESYCDIEYFDSDMKIYKIKVYDDNYNIHVSKDFKILCEINYNNLLNSKDEMEQSISAIKNKEKSVLDKFIKSNEIGKLKIVIKTHVHEYIDKITKTENKELILFLIKELGRNKDLDNFIKYDNNMIRYNISKIGRPKDFKTLLRYKTISSISDVLEQGKIKVIEYFLNTEDKQMFFTSIIKSGIDEYLDMFMDYKNKKLNKYIVEQGRKCDLDILVHDENEDIRKAVARHGYDDHLDILAKENNPDINWIINQLRGKGK
jgi:hypothetical protein